MIKGIIMLIRLPMNPSLHNSTNTRSVVVIGKVEGQYSHVYSVDTDNYGDSIALTNALIESGHRI